MHNNTKQVFKLSPLHTHGESLLYLYYSTHYIHRDITKAFSQKLTTIWVFPGNNRLNYCWDLTHIKMDSFAGEVDHT